MLKRIIFIICTFYLLTFIASANSKQEQTKAVNTLEISSISNNITRFTLNCSITSNDSTSSANEHGHLEARHIPDHQQKIVTLDTKNYILIVK